MEAAKIPPFGQFDVAEYYRFPTKRDCCTKLQITRQ